jgi:hypothetical protein
MKIGYEGVNMTEISVDFITGLMFGIEFPDVSEIDEDLSWAMALDLFVVRVMVVKWKKEAE